MADNNLADPFKNSATLDFNIAPWNEIFPELSFRVSDDALELVTIKLYEQINALLELRNYLILSSKKLRNSSELSKYINMDTTLFDKLHVLYGDIIKSSMGDVSIQDSSESSWVKFEGENYDLYNIENISSLTAQIARLGDNSSMKRSVWYSVVERLAKLGLIQPSGVLLVSQGDADYQKWELMYKQTSYDIGFARIPYPYYSAKDFGQQLGVCSGKVTNLSSVLPIVSEESRIVDNTVTSVYFINEKGNSVNSATTKFVDEIEQVQSIRLKNENRENVDGESVFEIVSSSSVYNIEYHRMKPPLSLFNANSTEHKQQRDILFYVVPITEYIMKSFDINQEGKMSMNVYYSSGNSLPKTLSESIFQ